ncbi:hypothetical protein WMR10_000288 [Stenotrophomonas maltophilia]|nr:hypothetical protein [Stenotrophomonas maltophilia]
MITAPPTFQLFHDLMSNDMGLFSVLLFFNVVLLGVLLSILLEHLWLALRHWMQRRKGDES